MARWTPDLRGLPAISVRQPWAWLIVNGFKDIENRSWTTRYRGTVLIHAGQSRADFTTEVLDAIHARFGIVVPDALDIGGIVGAVDIVDCVKTHPSKWHKRGCDGWILARPRRLAFRPCKGALSFFHPAGL